MCSELRWPPWPIGSIAPLVALFFVLCGFFGLFVCLFVCVYVDLLCLFAVSCFVRCRSGGLLSPLVDLWQRARELLDLTPIAALLLVSRIAAT
ncbi:hypothetical protein SLEP1_g19202 [Rubroshorea leprosula]|nr:hypothetical protein SLEP1_g19202 [Rubroshorea leprosula]